MAIGEEDYAEMFKSMKKKKKKSSKKATLDGEANEEDGGAEPANAIEKDNDIRYATVILIFYF